MCFHLYSNGLTLEQSLEQSKNIRKKSGYRVYWKVVKLNFSLNGLRSVFMKGHKWQPGWNKSNRKAGTTITSKESYNGTIDFGIHVRASRDEARYWYIGFSGIGGYRLIKVLCYNKDLVAIDEKNRKEAVYTKVFVPKDEINNAVNRKAIERR